MKWIAMGLGLALMLGAARADTPSMSQIYLTDVEAELGIAADGSVSAVKLPRTPALEGQIGDRLEERMRGWRFAVDAVNGTPSRVHVRLMLEAREIDTHEWQVRLSTPVFSGLQLGERPKAADYEIDGQRIKRTAVKWPSVSAQVSARVEVLVEYDADGKVTRAGTRRAQLLGVKVESHQTDRAEDVLQPFVREAERTLTRWRFPAAAAGETEPRSALVPVHFRPAGKYGPLRKWELAVAVHALERDWARADPEAIGPAPSAVPDDDLSFGLVRLLDPVDGQLL